MGLLLLRSKKSGLFSGWLALGSLVASRPLTLFSKSFWSAARCVCSVASPRAQALVSAAR